MSENVLLEEPVAIRSFYSDYKSPRRPTLAVASGSTIFMYRHLQQYNKFVVPPLDINEEEKIIWENLKLEKYDAKTAFEELLRLREHGTQLTNRSYEVLSLTDPTEIQVFINQRKNSPLLQQVCVCFYVAIIVLI
jgi:Bardet-Biedl syndrome 1 protein